MFLKKNKNTYNKKNGKKYMNKNKKIIPKLITTIINK